MIRGSWHKIKGWFSSVLPAHFGSRVLAVEDRHQTGGQSQTQTATTNSGVPLSTETLTKPPLHAFPRPARSQSLASGQIISGRFKILRFLSSGGMGEVYEAWDSELNERVALKTIRPEIASSTAAIDRFKQEVKQTRVISHVNVCRVYEVFSHEQSSGERIWFLTMELLEGRTLQEYLGQQNRFAVKQALELIKQMVAGLAAAHQLGIVHRDFKSNNVMLVGRGPGQTRAVITDFGLSLNVLTNQQAKPGAGTPSYMAPEQERGGPVSLAADQYALGVVICEMVTGQLPSRPDRTGKVLLPPNHRLSRRWEAVIQRSLAFRPEDRFKEVGDIISALDARTRSRRGWIVGAVALTGIVVGVVFLTSAGDRGSRVEELAQLTPDTDLSREPSISRDGKIVVYSSDRAEAGSLNIWVQPLPGGSPLRVTTDPSNDGQADIAPDGSSVVFRSERGGGGIYLATIAGERSERLLVPFGRNPRFSPDGTSVAYWSGDRDTTIASGGLFVLSLAYGSSVRLASDFKDARLPVWSSDGRYILFTGCRMGERPLPACSEWWVTSRDGTRVQNTGALAQLAKEQIDVIDVGGWYGDTVLFGGRKANAWSLWELAISPTSLRVTGKARQLTSGDVREVAPSLAANNTIAVEHLAGALHVWCIEHALNPNQAVAKKVTQDAAVDLSPSVSRNGRWLAFSRGFGNKRDIWIRDMQSGTESLFLSSALDKLSPVINDSGETVVFEERDQGVPSVFTLTRGQPKKKLCTECSSPSGWFDGHRGVFYRAGIPSKIEMFDFGTGEEKTVLEASGTSLSEATWSPENQYLLFTASKNGGKKQVFAVFFPKSRPVATGAWIPITSDLEFSDRPRWSNEGKTIFYLSTRDGFSCIWAQHFDAKRGTAISRPFAVMHYHNSRFSPALVASRSFNISVAGDSVYLNVGEISASIWTGVVRRRDHFSFFSRFR
jgi:eukaryotic-like serine/threonine-protein kinase